MQGDQATQLIEAEEMVRRQFQRKGGKIPPILFCWMPNEPNGRMYRLGSKDPKVKVDQKYILEAIQQMEVAGAYHVIVVSTGKIEKMGTKVNCVFALSFTMKAKFLRRAIINRGNQRDYLSPWETLANKDHPNIWAPFPLFKQPSPQTSSPGECLPETPNVGQITQPEPVSPSGERHDTVPSGDLAAGSRDEGPPGGADCSAAGAVGIPSLVSE